jgi:hypothetical protein
MEVRQRGAEIDLWHEGFFPFPLLSDKWLSSEMRDKRRADKEGYELGGAKGEGSYGYGSRLGGGFHRDSEK